MSADFSFPEIKSVSVTGRGKSVVMHSSTEIRVHLKTMKMQERMRDRADLEVMMLTFLNEWEKKHVLTFYITLICISPTVFLSLLFFSAVKLQISSLRP